ncbi:jg12252 [Pararge aegeria aegeria]|uniref:Jg12252 protein n=1 Tax=Pararge aegeria aegeria TaxID=348720 RepID=A0A8S4S4D8_9NEOP|nr:jg12252 [Pararge aegeria aegeria]
MRRAMLGASLRDQIRNVEIRRRTRFTDIAQWPGTQFGAGLDVGVPRCWNGSPTLVCAALVDLRRGRRTTLGASQDDAGFKRHKTVEFGAPYK